MLFLLSGYSICYDKIGLLRLHSEYRFNLIWGIEKAPIIIFSTVFFLVFKNLNIGFNKLINWVAASAFGVYLLHMNNWTTNIIWNKICRTKDYYQSSMMIIHVLVCCALIYIVCTGVDKIRIYCIEQPIENAAININSIKSKVTFGLAGIVAIVAVLYISSLKLFMPFESSLSYNDCSSIVMLEEGTELAEKFYNEKNLKLKQVSFHTITWGKIYEEKQSLTVSIRDVSNKKLIFSQNICMNNFGDQGDYVLSPVGDIRLKKNHWYSLEFTSNTVKGQNSIALMLTGVSNNSENVYIDGRLSEGHLSATISAKK